MNRIKKETVVTAAFILCISTFFVCLIPTYYSVFKQTDQSTNYNWVAVNWEERYPFSNTKQEHEDYTDENLFTTYQTRYLSLVTRLKTITTTVVTDGTIGRYPISELYCKLQKLMGYKRFESADSSVLLLDNNVYTYNIKTDNTLNNIEIVESISEFNQWLHNQGIQYLYVMEPYKIGQVNEDGIYEGYVDYTEYNMNSLASLMKQANVPFLDLQEKATEIGDVNELFYRTDHHWKPSTALWAAQIVAIRLNEDCGYQIDVTRYDENNFIAINYGNCFLGSQGKKVTLGVTGPDDFELILPAYYTNLNVKIENLGIEESGTFEETLIDKNQLSVRNYPYNFYTNNEYASYGYGDQPLITIENNQAPNDLKVLILKDSYVDSMGPFFSLGVKNLTMIDLRHFTGSIRTFIQEEKPDIVITMLAGGSYVLDENDVSHTNILDYK